jgi:glyoxylase-like metal-dependent hydrolase (beta-lactamase superfamily II)/8-oxo-dGTP pyrophosphatase MutT (NUDIX family)
MPASSGDSPTPFGPATDRPPRPSATLVLVRDAADGPEVLLVRRAEKGGDQNSNRWVFPGGLIDASDGQLHAFCRGLDDATASRELGLMSGGLNYLIAAVRETLEETGLLLAVDHAGLALGPSACAVVAAWRAANVSPAHGEAGAALASLCHREGWLLTVGSLMQISHWITPLGLPKRFDTRFMLARAPDGQTVHVDGTEIVEHRWARAAALLQPASEIKVIGPARAILKELAPFADVVAMQAWAAALGVIAPIQPRLARDEHGQVGPIQPSHPAYAEIGRIDPQGRALGYSTIRPDTSVELAPGVLRVTANNGHFMTGPGTNSYLLRCGSEDAGEWALIDPGPADENHVQALLDCFRPGKLVAILATHTHTDHSPASARLKALTGATVYGRLADHPAGQDASFAPDVQLKGGECLQLGSDLSLRVIHTPGHASNHLCFVHQGHRLLFTGDHVMQGSTVVINPPDGNMTAYLDALEALLAQATSQAADFDWIAPGHGFLIQEPARVLKSLLRHRQRRESKVIMALTELARETPVSLDALLARVYDDVPAERHPIARRSLLAHLDRLHGQSRASRRDDLWSLA